MSSGLQRGTVVAENLISKCRACKNRAKCQGARVRWSAMVGEGVPPGLEPRTRRLRDRRAAKPRMDNESREFRWCLTVYNPVERIKTEAQRPRFWLEVAGAGLACPEANPGNQRPPGYESISRIWHLAANRSPDQPLCRTEVRTRPLDCMD